MWQELELEKFITHEVSFSEINKAFEYMLRGDGLRCIIRMDPSSRILTLNVIFGNIIMREELELESS